MNRLFQILLAFGVCCVARDTQAQAAIQLPAVFSDHMVLQSGQPIPVWGKAAPESRLTVALGQTQVQTTCDADGRWRTLLPALPANSTPQTLNISGDGNLAISDVLIGEVWLCSGQSNMGMRLSRAKGGEEAIAASEDPLLRNFNVKAQGEPAPQENCEGSWQAATSQTSGSFSAVAYFFARQLRRELGVPVGIIHASVGGTPIEAWTRRDALKTFPFMESVLKESDAKIAATPEVGNVLLKSTPGWLYNGYIHPLVGYGIRGFVWYQGESNVDNAFQYRELFPALINDWRQLWNNPTLPFLFVQVAARDSNQDESVNSPTAELREAQALAETLPNTYMTVAIDTRAADWHPLDKETPGTRLGNSALSFVYNQRDIPHRQSRYLDMRRKGAVIKIRFRNAGGLKAKGEAVQGFTIADTSHKFVPAEAKIIGETVEVRANGVLEPVAVRYGWSRGPHCNLFNSEDLPVAPFRTDDWPGATWPKK